jgi:hypothetical protein
MPMIASQPSFIICKLKNADLTKIIVRVHRKLKNRLSPSSPDAAASEYDPRRSRIWNGYHPERGHAISTAPIDDRQQTVPREDPKPRISSKLAAAASRIKSAETSETSEISSVKAAILAQIDIAVHRRFFEVKATPL